jgi:hypothetical protein
MRSGNILSTDRHLSSLMPPRATYSSAAMRCGIELSADEILGEPDDQVVIHGHLCAFAVRPLVPVVGGVAMSRSRASCSAASISGAVETEQAGSSRASAM